MISIGVPMARGRAERGHSRRHKRPLRPVPARAPRASWGQFPPAHARFLGSGVAVLRNRSRLFGESSVLRKTHGGRGFGLPAAVAIEGNNLRFFESVQARWRKLPTARKSLHYGFIDGSVGGSITETCLLVVGPPTTGPRRNGRTATYQTVSSSLKSC